MRKKQKADQEAEDRRRLAARNFSEGQKRFREQKKRHTRVVPPWVEEHPEVFKDAEFSITQTGTESSVYFDPQRGGGGDTVSSSAMEVSGIGQPVWTREVEEEGERQEEGIRGHNQMAWVSNCQEDGLRRSKLVSVNNIGVAYISLISRFYIIYGVNEVQSVLSQIQDTKLISDCSTSLLCSSDIGNSRTKSSGCVWS